MVTYILLNSCLRRWDYMGFLPALFYLAIRSNENFWWSQYLHGTTGQNFCKKFLVVAVLTWNHRAKFLQKNFGGRSTYMEPPGAVINFLKP